eukprot:7028215-Pyramimonas_sp.AAC.1
MGTRTSELSMGRLGARANDGKHRRCNMSSSAASPRSSSTWQPSQQQTCSTGANGPPLDPL